jgi:prepilin-type N-terminal cleavage/methylation domain-containing protein
MKDFPLPCSAPSPGLKKPFTLIELLVVIAIIAILASMLLPALQQARERGKLSKCISNMSNLAKAFHAYADDNKDYFAPYWNGLGGGSKKSNGTWSVSFANPAPAGYHFGLYANYLGVNQQGIIFGFRDDGKNKYLCKYACPNLPAKKCATGSEGFRVGINMLGRTGQVHTGLKRTRVMLPSRYAVYIEAESNSTNKRAYDNVEGFYGQLTDNAIAYRHGAGANPIANIVFADGRADAKNKFKIPGVWSMTYAYYNCFYTAYRLSDDKTGAWFRRVL